MSQNRRRPLFVRWRRPAIVAVTFGIIAFGLSWRVLLPAGLIGHHWDWGIPSSPAELRNMANSTRFAWYPVSLGSFVSFRYGITILEALIGLPGYLGISGETVAKGMILIDIWISGISMYCLIQSLQAKRPDCDATDNWHWQIAPAVAGLVYMGSPFQFDQIIAGDIGGLAAYAILPLGIAFFWKGLGYTSGPNNRHLAASALAFGLAFACSTQPTMMAAIIALVPPLVTQSHRFLLLLRAAAVGVVSVLVNTFWLLPAVLGSRPVATAAAVTPAAGDPYAHYSSLLASLEGWTYFVPFFWNGLNSTEQHIWAGLCMLVIVAAVALVLLQKVNVPKKLYSMGLCLVVEFGVAVLVGAPASALGTPIRVLLHAPVVSLIFRTPQHLVFPSAILASILIGIALQRPMYALSTDSYKVSRPSPPPVVVGGCIAALVIVAAFPLNSTITDYIGPFHQSRSYIEAQAYLNTHGSQQGRLIVLPGGTSEYFQAHPPGSFYLDAGDDANALWSLHPVLSLNTKWNPLFNARMAEQLLVDQLITKPVSASPLLNQLAVQYIEVAPVASPGSGPLFEHWNELQAVARLKLDQRLQRVFARGNWYIFRNTGFTSQLMSVTPIRGQHNVIADAAVPTAFNSAGSFDSTAAQVTSKLQPAHNIATAMLTAQQYISSAESQHKVNLVTLNLARKRASNGVASYDLQSQLAPCDVYANQARVEFKAKSAQPGWLLVLLPDGTDQGRAFEAVRPVGRRLSVYSVAFNQLTPVNNPTLSSVRQISVLGVDPLTLHPDRHIGLTVRSLRIEAPRPPRCSTIKDQGGWFMANNILPATWNYSEGLRQPYATIQSPTNLTNRLSILGNIPKGGVYQLEAALIAPGSGWSMQWQVAGATEDIASTGGSGGARYEFISLGKRNLDAGTLTATATAECSTACNLGVIGIVAVPVLGQVTAAGTLCRIGHPREANPGAFKAIAHCPTGGVITLSETTSAEWQAVARSAHHAPIVLRHVTMAGWENGWQLPPGNWQITVIYAEQETYRVSQLAALVVLVLLIGITVGPSLFHHFTRKTSAQRDTGY